MIPLGLYRTVKVNLKAFKGDSSNSRARKTKVVNGEQPAPDYDEVHKWIHYVITNPDKDTRLEKSDLIFVLARSDPGDPETWDDYDNQNQDVFQMINSKNGMFNKDKHSKESTGKGGANAQGGDAPGAKKGGAGSSNNAYYSNMQNKSTNPVEAEEGGE